MSYRAFFLQRCFNAGSLLKRPSQLNHVPIFNKYQTSIRCLPIRSMVMITKTQAGFEQDDPKDMSKAEEPIAYDSSQDLTITDACYQRIRALADRRKDANLEDLYLRVYVDAGGCSGFQYKFELTLLTDEAIDQSEDVVYENSGSRVVVDKTSLELIAGSKIDFVQEMIKSSFAVVENPQSESACGCGSSFAIKNFEANPALD